MRLPMRNNPQANYNTLASACAYLIWMTDPANDQEYQDRDDALKIIRAAKNQIQKESGHGCDMSLSWDYGDKWEVISDYERTIVRRIKDSLRPILGY